MKKKTPFLLPICAAGLLFACIYEWDNSQRKDDDFSSGDCEMIYTVVYTVTVVNNTDKEVQLYGPGYFLKYLAKNKAKAGETLESGTVICTAGTVICTVSNKGSQTGTFLWNTGKSGFSNAVSIETIKANFEQYTASFYLKFTIDSDEYYLAGWSAAENNNLVDYQGNPFSFPANKIKAHGIGYCENTEIRIDKNGYAYIPFTMNYDGKHRDFDDAIDLIATATLTLNSPDDIRFETTSITRANPAY
jgi:hypothetical protein